MEHDNKIKLTKRETDFLSIFIGGNLYLRRSVTGRLLLFFKEQEAREMTNYKLIDRTMFKFITYESYIWNFEEIKKSERKNEK